MRPRHATNIVLDGRILVMKTVETKKGISKVASEFAINEV